MTLGKVLNDIKKAIDAGVPIDSDIRELSNMTYIDGKLEELTIRVTHPDCYEYSIRSTYRT